MASLRPGGCVDFNFLLPSTGRQGFEQRHFSLTVRHRGRILWGRPSYMNIVTKWQKKKKKKPRAKVKETDLALKSQNWLFPVTGCELCLSDLECILRTWPHSCFHKAESEWESLTVVSDSLWHGLCRSRNSPGQNDLPNPGSNPGLPHCRWILSQLNHQGCPRILEWVAYSFSRGSSWPRNWTGASCIAGGFFTSWATRETNSVIYNLWKQHKRPYWDTILKYKILYSLSIKTSKKFLHTCLKPK